MPIDYQTAKLFDLLVCILIGSAYLLDSKIWREFRVGFVFFERERETEDGEDQINFSNPGTYETFTK